MQIDNQEEYKESHFLTIAPALPVLSRVPVLHKLNKRSFSTFRYLLITANIYKRNFSPCILEFSLALSVVIKLYKI